MAPIPDHSRRIINPPNRVANLPFGDPVLVDDALYMSGRIRIDSATGVVPLQVRRFEMMGIAVRAT